MKANSVKRLDSSTAWAEPWFPGMLCDGLAADGMSADATAELRALFDNARITSLPALIDAAEQAELTNQKEIIRHLKALDHIASFNQSCYRRDKPEQTRVISWPNNPKIRQSRRSHYFDIFEDLPYRETFDLIDQSTPIGSAGSCFALRIAHQLQAWNYNYVIEEDDLPDDFPLSNLANSNFRTAPARVGTLFNTPSMRQMVERAFGEWEPDPLLYESNGKLKDPFRSIAPLYQDEDGFLNDYAEHSAALRRALTKCKVFVLTLGLTEAWKFAHSQDFTSVAPHLVHPTLLRRHELTVAENVAELERLLEVYQRHCPDIKLIISVSPVPLNKTFSTTQHVVTANSLSKATLRVAAEEFCRNHPDQAFYFPSYEVVTCGTANPWEEDMRHVSADAVERVMMLFRRMFFVDKKTEFKMASLDKPSVQQATSLRGRLKSAISAFR